MAGRALQHLVQPVGVVQAADAAGAVAGQQHLRPGVQAEPSQQHARRGRRDALPPELPGARLARACA